MYVVVPWFIVMVQLVGVREGEYRSPLIRFGETSDERFMVWEQVRSVGTAFRTPPEQRQWKLPFLVGETSPLVCPCGIVLGRSEYIVEGWVIWFVADVHE